MANTNSKDLEERLSPWGVSMEEQTEEAEETLGHHSPTPQDQLNEKLSTWGVKLKDQHYDSPTHSPTLSPRGHGRQSPASPHRSPSGRGRQSPASPHRSPSGQGRQSPASPHRSPGAKDRNMKASGMSKDNEEATLKEKVATWGVHLEGGGEDLVLKRRLMREGSEIEIVHYTFKGLQDKLMEWGINTETIQHPEVFTVEQALPHLRNFEGMFAKNLFLRDKKKRLYLFCAPHDADISLTDLARLVGAPGGLRFAAQEVLEEKLGLTQGAVTLFGLINDQYHDVKLILDHRLIDGTYPRILFHPIINSATTAISPNGLKTFLAQTGHTPVQVDISTQSTIV